MKQCGLSAAASIDANIEELGDWRGRTLANLREMIHEADPGIAEERAEGCRPRGSGAEPEGREQGEAAAPQSSAMIIDFRRVMDAAAGPPLR